MNELLRLLAESDQEKEAPPAVEVRLKAAFRKRYRPRKWPYLAVAAAAVLTLFIATRPEPQTLEIAVATPSAPVLTPAKPARQKTVRRKPAQEIMTEFYPLMEDPPPFERGELLRVSVPASAMRGVGLPVSEEHLEDLIQADVLVGQEGLARAIRFVRYEH
jgi:hypothetical protein